MLLQDADWHAPLLWRSEFRSVVNQYLRKKLLSFEEGLSILHQAESLLAGREHQMASKRIMHFAASSECSTYDCEFVATAEFHGAPLVAVDQKIIRTFPKTAVALDTYLQ